MILSLKKKLETWVAAGLITNQQSSQITAFEEQKGGSRSWAIYGIGLIGAVCVATGLVSLVAANWDEIPMGLKLGSYFFIQALVGWGLWTVGKKDSWIKESVLTAYAFLFLGGIGLIAQVFNLSGDGWQALTLWLVITFALASQAETFLLPHAWVAMAVFTYFQWWSAHHDSYSAWRLNQHKFSVLPSLLIALALWGEAISLVREKLKSALIVWGFAGLFGFGSVVGNGLWYDGRSGREAFGYLIVPWLALIFACLGSLFRLHGVSMRQRVLTVTAMLSLGLYYTLGAIQTFPSNKPTAQICGAAGFMIVWTLGAAAAANAGYKRLFDIATAVIAIRFVVIYFEVIGTLAATGMGLVLSGLVILGVAYLWHRLRAPLREKAGL